VPGRSLASVYVSVRGETSELGRDIETGARRADTGRVGEHAGRQYGHAFAGGARRIIGGVSALVAAAGIGTVVRESVRGFKEHQQVVAQTNAVLRSTKGAANVSTGAVVALSDALERKTKVDGDVILSGSNMLATFCLEEAAQALSRERGWVSHGDLRSGDEVLAYDPETGEALWEPVESVHRFAVDSDEMVRWQSRQIDVLSTPTHRWWTVGGSGYGQRQRFRTTAEISGHQVKVKIGGGAPAGFRDEPVLSDETVQLLGWVATEGWYDHYRDQSGRRGQCPARLCAICSERPARNKRGPGRCDECADKPIQAGRTQPRERVTAETSAVVGVSFSQSVTANPEKVDRIADMVRILRERGHTIREYEAVAPYNGSTLRTWRLSGDLAREVRKLLPGKKLTLDLFSLLTAKQAALLLDTLILGDGHVSKTGGVSYIQKDAEQLDVVAMLGAMLGVRTTVGKRPDQIHLNVTEHAYGHQLNARTEHYQGIVWCPHLRTGVWMARVRGRTFWTGNTNIQNRVGAGNDIFNRATATVLDMSVALGQDTKNSAIQLGKALNDPVKGVTALQRVGVTFTRGQREQIDAMVKAGNVAGAQKVILAELNKEFGGSAKAQGDALGAQGRLIVAWHQAQDVLGAALLPVVDRLGGALADRLPGAADRATAGIRTADVQVRAFIAGLQGQGPIDGFSGKLNTLGLGVRALVAAYREGDITSTGFVGSMEQIGVSLSHVRDYLRQVDFHKLSTDAAQVGRSLRGIDVQGLATQLRSVDTSHFADGLNLAGRALGFVAQHADLVIKALPVLLAGYAAYKAAEAAANVAALAGIPIRAAQVASNFVLARSIRSLAAGNVENAVATGGMLTAQAVNIAVTDAATASTQRGTFASIAAATAQKVLRVATLAGAAAGWVLKGAMAGSLGPIGVLITIVAAAAAGLIYMYHHSQTFRRIVDGAFHAVAAAGQFMWERVLKPTFAFLANAWFAVAGAIVNGAARAFGWVPGLGGRLRAAAAHFNTFRDQFNRSMSGMHDRTVRVNVQLGAGRAVVGSGANAVRIEAQGGVLKRFAAGAEDHIAQVARPGEWRLWAEPETGGEAYIPLAASKRARSTAILAHVASQFGYGLTPAAAGLVISPQLSGKRQFDASLDAYERSLDRFALRVGQAVQKQLGSASLDGAVRFAKSIAGSPYVWGGASPSGSDCSGFLSMLVEVVRGQRPGGRLFSTTTLPAGYFATTGNVNRAFRIGWFAGNPGHVAATVNGIGMESRGGDGVVVNGYNGSSRGADYGFFSRHAFLRMARGGILPGDPPFDLLDRRGKHYRPGLLEALEEAARRPRMLDTGGWLPPGLSVVGNGTGRAERVRSGTQEDELLAALLRLEQRVVELGRQPVIVQMDSRPVVRAVRNQNTRNVTGW
jgi:hypothetical protein